MTTARTLEERRKAIVDQLEIQKRAEVLTAEIKRDFARNRKVHWYPVRDRFERLGLSREDAAQVTFQLVQDLTQQAG